MSAGLYRYRAQECTANARQAVAAGERVNWLSLAEQWLRLADEVESRQLTRWGVCDKASGSDLDCAQQQSFAARRLCQH